MLLYREPANGASLSAVAITKFGTRPIAAKKFKLDVEREIADASSDPHEFLIGGHGAIDQYHRRRRVAALIDEPTPDIEQHNDEVPVDDAFRRRAG